MSNSNFLYDSKGYDVNGYNKDGLDSSGYNILGYNLKGEYRYRFNREGKEVIFPLNQKVELPG